MSTEVHGKVASDGTLGCEGEGTSSGNSTIAEVPANSVCVRESEIKKGIPAIARGNCQSEEGSDESGSKKDVEKDSFVIDIKPQRAVGGSFEGEKICRICHLSSEQVLDMNASKVTGKGSCAASFGAELILLGCGCKDELGTAHRHCAEAWFKLKGNRFCEICGETAKNVYGVGDNRFMEEWNDGRSIASTSIISSSERGDGCWRRQPFCNFLMACLVMAFVLPWFFRVNMF